jgi:hypothetical protein
VKKKMRWMILGRRLAWLGDKDAAGIARSLLALTFTSSFTFNKRIFESFNVNYRNRNYPRPPGLSISSFGLRWFGIVVCHIHLILTLFVVLLGEQTSIRFLFLDFHYCSSA